jgi:RHS repeat-associated protein
MGLYGFCWLGAGPITDLKRSAGDRARPFRNCRRSRPFGHLRSSRFLSLFSLLCAFIFTDSALAASAPPVMIVPGQYSVSQTGALTYSIPIAAPPASGGMVPALSLDYSSQNGDGLEGLGWTLSGLPSITRCAQTIAQDGQHGSVNYDDSSSTSIPINDRLCLNGQRLVAISGVYGRDGSEYRTELEGFTQVIVHGVSGINGPGWIEVHTKAGQTMQFGNSTSSRIFPVSADTLTPVTTVVRTWAVNQISDSVNNYMTVNYTTSTKGQTEPSSIQYGGHLSGPTTAPYNQITFSYSSSRLDSAPIFQAGMILQTTDLLTSVATYTGTANTLVSYYALNYSNGSASTHSHLTSVTLCNNASCSAPCNGTQIHCLASTTFGWQGGLSTLNINEVQNDIGHGGYIHYGNGSVFTNHGKSGSDFNGDGLTDVLVLKPDYPDVCTYNEPNKIFYGQLDGSFIPANMTSHFNGDHGDDTHHVYYPDGNACFYFDTSGSHIDLTYTADLDSDGITDVAPRNILASTVHTMYMHNDGMGLFNRYGPEDQNFFLSADFNGDGQIDGTYDYGYAINSAGAFTKSPQTFPTWTDSTLGDVTLTADFDGDGCADFLYQIYKGPKEIFYDPLCTAKAPLPVPDWTYNDGKNVTLGDFNGDGKTDILVTGGGGSVAAVLYLSTGTSLVATTLDATTNDWGKYSIVTGDWNGDGKSDLALIADGASGNYGPPSHTHQIMLSTGNGFVVGPTIANQASSGTTIASSVSDWNSDGTQDLWLQQSPHDFEELMSVTAATPYAPEMISSIDNGIGSVTTITYDKLNNPAIYSKATDATSYPTQNVIGALYVVSRVDASNGQGRCVPPSMLNCYSSTYKYAGAKTNLQGRGFLGFQSMTVTDTETNIVQTTTYFTDFPQTGLINTQTKSCPVALPGCPSSGVTVPLTSLQNTYDVVSLGTGTDGVSRNFVAVKKVVVAATDLDQTPTPGSTTIYAYDCDTIVSGASICAGTSATGFGNALSIAVTVTDGSSKTTTNTYNNFPNHWFLGRLLSSTVESIVGTSDLIRQTSYNYAPSTGLLTRELIEPESSTDPSLKLATNYTYDAYGNKSTSITSGCVWVSTTNCSNGTATATRETDAQFDDTVLHGQFLTKTTNALGQYETWAYATDQNAGFGRPSSHTGPNGLTTSFAYDGYGRKTLETQPSTATDGGGNQTAIGYFYCSAIPCTGLPTTIMTLPPNTQFISVTTPMGSIATGSKQNGPMVVAYYDSLSRPLGTDVQGFDSPDSGCTPTAPCWIRTESRYDAIGRVQKTSRHYFLPSGLPEWTAYSYDALGRVYSKNEPGNVITNYGYDGLTTTVTNNLVQVTTTVKNAQGLVASVEDNDSNITTYTYDAFDDLLKIKAPSNTTSYTYDIRGRKITAHDPDMGPWSYVYDGFGELYSQTDAKSNLTTLTYDALGRVTERDEPDLVSNWTFDNAPGAGVGQLATATTNGGYSRSHSYDTLGRPVTVGLTVNGSVNTYSLGYDHDSQLQTVGYPSGFIAKYTYTTNGYPYRVQDAGGTNQIFWTANTRDADLQLLTQTAGNSIVTTQTFDPQTGRPQTILAGTSNSVSNQAFTFDSLGNLTERTWLNNAGASVRENACYDDLNRLTSTRVTSTALCTGAGTTISIFYDALGNITQKTDICATANCMVYGAGAGPHALTSIVGTYNGVSNPNFTYDQNGNMVAGAGRTVTSTSFNMAALITDGANSVALTYDSEHKRIKQVAAGTGSPITTLYLNDPVSGAMEEKVGSTTTNDYIMADGHMIAERISTIGLAVHYFTLDHLGSISVITDSTGAVVERLSYDAWGKRRNSDGSADPTCSLTSSTTRGFTGQEMMPSVCLINFNARVYDPSLGRFMSADPVMQDEFNLQLLNRYSYVGNNPLSITDPSGLCFLGCFWDSTIFKSLVAIVIAYVVPEALGEYEEAAGLVGSFGGVSLNAINAGIAGGIGGFVTTGKLNGVVFGALEATMFFNAGDFIQSNPTYFFGSSTATTFIAHGMVGGLFSVGSKGGFASGFLAAGVGSLAEIPALHSHDFAINVAENAILGGTGSVLGGGKFENGAITGAFGYLYNECMHSVCWASATDLAALKSGGPYGFWKSMCAGGDPIACEAEGSTANAPVDPLSLGTVAKAWLETAYQDAHATQWTVTRDGTAVPLNGQMTPQIEMQYSQAIAEAYINYIGTTQSKGVWPSWTQINNIHWQVNQEFGLPSSAYGATPLGPLAPNLMKGWICPSCAP